jgi:hypothetical protein
MTGGAASSVRERGRACANGPRGLALLGRERGKCERACRPRARAQCGWAEWAERGEEVDSGACGGGLCFSFSKNVNSNKFCLFCCELFKIQKMVNIIV